MLDLRSSRYERVPVHTWLTEVRYLVFLLLLIVGSFWTITLTDQYTWLNAPDLSRQVLPWIQFQAREWHAGRFPLWDPYHWAGQPLVGQSQPGAVYPLNWLLFLSPLQPDGFVSLRTLNWYLIAIHWMAAAFSYSLCRYLCASRLAAVLAGSIYSLGGYIGTTEWPQMLNGAVWAPLILLCLFRILDAPGRLLNAALGGACLGLAFLSGHHQQPTFFGLMTLLFWVSLFAGRKVPLRKAITNGVTFALFAGLVAAAQVLPAVEYNHFAPRWVGSRNAMLWSDSIPYTVHDTFALNPVSALGIVIPDIYTNSSPYVGFTAVVLAVIAVRLEWHAYHVRFLALLAVGALIFSTAGSFGLHGLLYSLIPFVEKSRNPSTAVSLLTLAIAALAGIGLDRLRGDEARWKLGSAILAKSLFGVSLLLYSTLFVIHAAQGDKVFLRGRTGAAALACLLLASVLTAHQRGALPVGATSFALLALSALELSTVTGHAFANKENGWEEIEQLRRAQDVAEFIRKEPQPVRVSVDKSVIAPNFGDWFGIEQWQGYTGVTRNIISVHHLRGVERLLGVTHWVGKNPQHPAQTVAFEGAGGLKVFRNPDAFPRAWSVHQAQSEAAEADVLQKIPDPVDALRSRVLLAGPSPELEQCAGVDEVAVVARGQSRVVIRADMACKGMVIDADTFFPGWQAAMDGAPAAIYSAYALIRGVVVPAGRHTIEFRYRPVPVMAGGALTIVGLLAVIAWWCLDFWKRKQRPA